MDRTMTNKRKTRESLAEVRRRLGFPPFDADERAARLADNLENIFGAVGSSWSSTPGDDDESTICEPPDRLGDPLFFCENFAPTEAVDLVEISAEELRAHVATCDKCRGEMVHRE